MDNNVALVNMTYNKEREYDMKGIIIPLVGDILYYDRVDMQIIVLEISDDHFYNERYIPIGIVISISGIDIKTIKVLTPYFIETEFTEKDLKVSEKDMLKELKGYIKKYIKDIFNKDILDLKFSLPNKKDLLSIIYDSDKIIDKIPYLCNIVNYKNNSIDNNNLISIINKMILLYNDSEHIRFTYNMENNYNVIPLVTDFEYSNKLKEFFDNDKDYVNAISTYIIPIATVTLN